MLSIIKVNPARKIMNKKELKAHILVSPENLMVQDSSLFNPLNGGNFTYVTSLPIGYKNTFVLPSEYDRRYFGTIEITTKGIKIR